MPTVFSRDLSLDLSLESEARTTLIILGIAIGVLLLATATYFLWYPTVRLLRRTLNFVEKHPETDVEESDKTPASEVEDMSITDTMSQLRHEQHSANTSRMAILFGPSPIRKYPSAPHRPKAVYRGTKGLHIPPPAALGSPLAEFRATTAAPGIVTPHVAGWMAVADSVVGDHPHALPLSARVATRAEIDVISGHVHIPWAYKDTKKTQPMAVKVQKPVIFHPAVPAQSRLLKDIGNVRGQDVPATSSIPAKRFLKVKHLRGKENMPPAPSPPTARCRK